MPVKESGKFCKGSIGRVQKLPPEQVRKGSVEQLLAGEFLYILFCGLPVQRAVHRFGAAGGEILPSLPVAQFIEAENQIVFRRSAVAAGAVHSVPEIVPDRAAPLLMQTAADGPELFCGVPS